MFHPLVIVKMSLLFNHVKLHRWCNGWRILDSSVVDRGFEHRSGPPKTIIFVLVASSLSTHHLRVRAKTGWLGIRITYPNEETCLPADCCFSELVQRGHHPLIKM